MKEFTITETLEDLDAESKYLVHKAREATSHAYAPYSKFLVGAAVLLEGDLVVTGSNQENAAYPSGMCAERIALFSAATLHPDVKILKVAVVAKRKTSKDLLPATCCGSCRQVILEFESRQESPIEVIMQSDLHQWVKSSSAAALLPFGFSKDNLDKH